MWWYQLTPICIYTVHISCYRCTILTVNCMPCIKSSTRNWIKLNIYKTEDDIQTKIIFPQIRQHRPTWHDEKEMQCKSGKSRQKCDGWHLYISDEETSASFIPPNSMLCVITHQTNPASTAAFRHNTTLESILRVSQSAWNNAQQMTRSVTVQRTSNNCQSTNQTTHHAQTDHPTVNQPTKQHVTHKLTTQLPRQCTSSTTVSAQLKWTRYRRGYVQQLTTADNMTPTGQNYENRSTFAKVIIRNQILVVLGEKVDKENKNGQ